MIMNLIRRILVSVLVPSVLLTSSMAGYAHADIVTTDTVIDKYSAEADRARIAELFSRADVQAEFEQYGISPDEAQQRLAALSDEEVQKIASRIDSDPAGTGTVGAVVGAAVLVFLVLLFTDILCLTDVFDFTRCSR